MFASIKVCWAGHRINSRKLSVLFGAFFIFLLIGFFISPPLPVQADSLRTLHMEWNYDTSLPGLAGYRIYENGILFGEIKNPAILAADIDVWLTDGSNSFTLTAFDVDGNESPQSAPYLIDNTPAANLAPTADIQTDVVAGEAPLTVAFDGTGSTDPDGSISGYFWELGDGASRFDDFFTYTFEASGVYAVRLTVTDDGGAIGQRTVVITVTDPMPTVNATPVAVIDASVLTGDAPLAVVFNGSWSNDPDGTIVSYQWDFGDGQIETGVQASHTFTVAGDYAVTLTVTDNDGGTAVSQKMVSVSEAPPPVVQNIPPQAFITSSIQTGAAPLPVTFDGSGSSDADGTLVNYRWDFSDGATANGKTVSHTFVNPGNYEVSLTVTDDQNASSSATVRIEVVAPVNIPPQAFITSSIQTGEAPLQVIFDGSGSSDADGTVVSYRWDFSDGATANGKAVSHTFVNPGSYTVSLTVTDDQNASSRATVRIEVVAPVNISPQAFITTSIQTGEAPLQVIFDGSGSSDADGTVVSYRWDFSDGAYAIGKAVSHTFVNPGSYTVSLTVTDDQNASSSATVGIEVAATVNNPPVAGDDGATVFENGTVLIDVLLNDQDPDGDPLAIMEVGPASNGTTSIEGNSIRYITKRNSRANDSFTYSVSDGKGGTAQALVKVSVVPVPSVTRGNGRNK